jgi:hypothetical protein
MSYATTYQGLTADILAKVEDQSDEVLANLDTIISVAETKVLSDLDLEIFQEFVTGNALTAHSRNFVRPDGVIKINGLWLMLGNSRKYIEKRAVGYCDMWAEDATVESFPTFYAEQDDTNTYFVNTPDQAYPVVIYGIKRPAGLSVANPTTWLSKYAADLLLLACLVGTEEYLSNQGQAGIWKGEYDNDRLPKTKLELRGLQRDDYQLSRAASTAGTPI